MSDIWANPKKFYFRGFFAVFCGYVGYKMARK